MEILWIYFLPTILALGIVTSYADLKEGKIRNKYVVAALIVSAATHALLWGFGVVEWQYLLYMAGSIGFALLLGFGLWYAGFWSAGDAKLYAAFVSLVPLDSYVMRSTQIPTGDFLINAFTVAAIYLLVKMMLETDTLQKTGAVKKSLKPKEMGYSIFAIFSVSWLTKYIFLWTGIRQEYLLNIILIMIILSVIRRVWVWEHTYLLILFSILRIFVNAHAVLRWEFLVSFVLTLAGFIILTRAIDELAASNKKRVKVYDLKPDMILQESFDRRGLRIKLDREGVKKAALVPYKGRLSQKHIDVMKNAHRAGKLHFNTIEVMERQAFAHYLFMAALMTLVVQGNVLVFLKSLL